MTTYGMLFASVNSNDLKVGSARSDQRQDIRVDVSDVFAVGTGFTKRAGEEPWAHPDDVSLYTVIRAQFVDR